MAIKILRDLAFVICLFHCVHNFCNMQSVSANQPSEEGYDYYDYYDKDDNENPTDNQFGYKITLLDLELDTFIDEIHADSSINHDNSSSGFSLYLLALYEPGCACGDELINNLERAAIALEQNFNEERMRSMGLTSLSTPRMGILNIQGFTGDGANKEIFQLLFEAEETPSLKFIMVEHSAKEELIDSLSNDEKEPGIYSLEYVGKSSTIDDIFDTVMHYWYRLIVSESTEFRTIQEMVKYASAGDTDFDNMDLIPTKPLFSMSNVEAMTDFLVTNAPSMFKVSAQDFYGISEKEEKYIRELMTNTDPYLVFVQCRKYPDSESSMPNVRAFQEFDELALHYLYRKDVAFFATLSRSCDWIQKGVKKVDPRSDGIVRILEIDPHESSKQSWAPTFFDPSTDSIFQSASSDEIMVFNMTQFAIVQSTPSILWFDRYTTATIAFPTYREIHFVLFVDMHSITKEDNYSDPIFLESQFAINLLVETSERHTNTRPFDDVVFMVVPSTATQILTTFGIDIWSHMDQECSGSDCTEESIPPLPAAIITSRAKSSDYMEVYHLPKTKMEDMKSCSAFDQRAKCKSRGTSGGSFYKFLNSYFERTIPSTMKSEQLSEQYIQQNYTLSSGVQIATASNFKDMVLADQNESPHSIVYFHNPTCGFCKRFDTTWHKLARLVSKMNWNSEISVVKVDISMNDLHLDGVNIKSLPAVYFFGKGRKDLPQKMLLEADRAAQVEIGDIYSNLGSVADPTVLLKWILNMLGKEDLEHLKSLASSSE